MRLNLALGLLLINLSFSGVLASSSEILSTGVGIIRGEVLTSRQVQISQMLEIALLPSGKPESLKLLPLDSRAFAKALKEALQEAVVALEAENFSAISLDDAEKAQARKKAIGMLKKNKAWLELQVTDSELDRRLLIKLHAKKFVQFRTQSSIIPVTDGEARKYFEENRLKFGNLPFDNFKENIKSFLSRTQVEKRLESWYELLLNKYQAKSLMAQN